DPPALAHRADDLTTLDRVARGHVGLAQMEISGHQALAVVEVHDLPGQIEVRHQSDDPAIRRQDRVTHGPVEIGAEVPAGGRSVESPACAERARDRGFAGTNERVTPEERRLMRLPGHVPGLELLAPDPSLRLGAG